MQITLVQSEIEQAIKDYIHSQIKVRDGMEIKIDLSATRGADGFKATIDIVESNAASPAPAAVVDPVKTAAPVKSTPMAAVVKEAAQAPAEQQPQEAASQAAASTEAATNAVAQANAESDAEEAASENGGQEPAEEQAQDPVTPPAGKSLFSGLRKPQNS